MPFAPSAFRSAAAAAALALALAAGSVPVASQGLDATLDLFVSGVKAGELTFNSELTGNRYTAATDMSSAGLVGAVADFYYRGSSSGRLDGDGGLVPQSFVALSKSRRAERETRIDFQDGTPVSVSVEPPRDEAPDPATQSGTLDPISAGLLLLRDGPAEELCNRTVDVFDGSRRSQLSLGAPRPEEGEIVCDGRFARIEGEAHSMSSGDKEYPFSVVFHDNGDGVAEFRRIETPTRFGKAVIERRG